jgi:hypothetical protein
MLPATQINLGDEKFEGKTHKIDFSNTRHHTHHIERDLYENVAANLSTKKFTVGKAKNYSKRVLKPTFLACKEITKRVLQVPFLIAKAGYNYLDSRNQTKKTRIVTSEATQNLQGLFNHKYKSHFAADELSNNLNTSKKSQAQAQTHMQIEQNLQKKAKLNGLSAYNNAPGYTKHGRSKPKSNEVGKNINQSTQKIVQTNEKANALITKYSY